MIPITHPAGSGPVTPAVTGTMVIEQRGNAVAAYGPA